MNEAGPKAQEAPKKHPGGEGPSKLEEERAHIGALNIRTNKLYFSGLC